MEFIVVGRGRCGSKLLMDYINQVHGTCGLGEVFRDWSTFVEEATGACPALPVREAEQLYEQDLVSCWELLYSLLSREYRHVGARVFYYHRPNSRIWEYFKNRCTVIHLVRHNALDTFLSEKLAGNSGRWREADGGGQYNVPVVIGVDEFIRFRKRLQRMIDQCRSEYSTSRYFEIDYDTLCQRSMVGAFLGDVFNTTVGPLVERIQKQRRGSLEEPIVNYDELQSKVGANGMHVR